jgi:4-alpha-glucanotransferase
MFKRSSGILVHPSSFPSSFGMGDFGGGAYEFIDFLYKSKQKVWQILPLGPINNTNSPYQCLSTFAGNTLFISVEALVEDGYLKQDDIENYKCECTFVIDYDKVKFNKTEIYKVAFINFKKLYNANETSSFMNFCDENKEWLDDYSLFVSLKDYYDDAIWTSWPEEIKNRVSKELDVMREKLSDDILYHKFLQYLFFKQWTELKDYANDKGIKVIGDIPIYMPQDSSDVWANPELYLLDEFGNPTFVAGGPPDDFSETGQRWGNCLYNWDIHEETGYSWWIKRISSTLKIVDIVRIDHFRGFDEYYAIPFTEINPANGAWCKGPGKSLFDTIIKELGTIPIIVEDIGIISDSVIELRENYDFPGIKILQCAFDNNTDSSNINLPHNVNNTNCVMYTGTHDTNTLIGWYDKLDVKLKHKCRQYMECMENIDNGAKIENAEDISWCIIKMAFSSISVYAILQVQDILFLNSEHRMNIPGTEKGNWKFRYLPNMLNEELSVKLAYITELYNR